jgi:LuxR family quorum-sensing transcriptional regulator LasR
MDQSPPKLTNRELEILKYIMIGKNRWEISTITALSESSVAFHTSNLLRKFDVSNRTQLSVKAMSMNLA